MRRLLAAVPLVLALAPAAQAAQVQTDRSCYLQTENTTVSLSGSGFMPAQPYTVSLDGQPLQGTPASIVDDGTMSGKFVPPALTSTQNERTFTLGLDSAGTSAQTSFSLTRFVADYTVVSRPRIPDPSKVRVRFFAYGFGLAAPAPTVYLHYLTPTGRASVLGAERQTVRLGAAFGPCGVITRSAIHRLFPFPKPRFGLWQLQFDTQKAYTPGTATSAFPWIRRGLCIQPVGAAKPNALHPCPTMIRR
jgi:hypothetical protein